MSHHVIQNSSTLFHKMTFSILKYMGLWKPQELPRWKSIFYYIHSTVVVTLIMTLGLCQFLSIFSSSRQDLTVFMQNLFVTLSTMCFCLKIINWIRCRPRIINITEMLKRHPFECQTSEEYFIYHRVSGEVRRYSLLHIMYIAIAALYYMVDQIFTTLPQRTLPLSAWLPYDYSNSSTWWISSTYLAISLYLAAIFNALYNSLFFELMMQIVAQVKILKHRVQVMMTKLLKASTKNHSTKNQLLLQHELFHNCVQYHTAILRLARDINAIFGLIMMIQYLVTSLALSSTAYLLSETMIFSRAFLKLTCYFGFLFQQIFILCYAGHRTYLEFDSIGDVLYTSDWITLSENNKQSIKLMLVNAMKPFIFDCIGMLKLDMEAFKNTLMLAYSIYNIF